jgi:SPP1 gp7 family putative phage head morphogenesis protein
MLSTMPRLKSWRPPDRLAAKLIRLIRRAELEVTKVLARELRADSVTGALAKLPELEAEFMRWLNDRQLLDAVTELGETSRAAADRQWARELTRAAGTPMAVDTLTSRMQTGLWIAANTSRLQGLRADTLTMIRADLETAARTGVSAEALAAHWELRGLPTTNGRLRGRALVIARDQLGKLAAQIAEAQTRTLGFTEYQWDDMPALARAQRDQHVVRRGKVFEWANPPPDGHPGHAINCRCRAVTVVSRARLREIEAGLPEQDLVAFGL